ncbi:unnamed protein product [Lampetra fluviatilis]
MTPRGSLTFRVKPTATRECSTTATQRCCSNLCFVHDSRNDCCGAKRSIAELLHYLLSQISRVAAREGAVSQLAEVSLRRSLPVRAGRGVP